MHQLLFAELVAVRRSDFERAATDSRLVRRARDSHTVANDAEANDTEAIDTAAKDTRRESPNDHPNRDS